MQDITIAALSDQPRIRNALSELLVETVASGGSVSFMHPLPLETADAFWRELAGRSQPWRSHRARRV